MRLNAIEKVCLLKLARRTIQAILNGKSIDAIEMPESELTEIILEKRGVFVSLHEEHELRGCIGYIQPLMPLWQAVIENARNAAFRDPRFTPLGVSELAGVHLEISVLTPPEVINDVSEFRIGIDGIILKKDVHQAVFLPQVAHEQGWDRETTLKHLSLKAGLDADAWREGASFETFQAEVFSEADFAG